MNRTLFRGISQMAVPCSNKKNKERKVLLSPVIFLIIYFLLTVPAQAQIKGKVIDAFTKEPLEFAAISVKETSATTLTNKLGLFLLETDSTATFTVTHIGYESKILQVSEYGDNVIALERGNVNLENITISQRSNHFNTISSIDLNLRPTKSSQDILKIVPGLFIAQHAGGGKAEQIFLRGFDIDHGTDIKITADGLPVNMISHAHGQGYADMHFIIPELVSNVDYGKGPYFTEHGNLNTAGYVSLQTVNKLEKSRIQVEGGQFNTFRGLALIDLLGEKIKNKNAYIGSEFLFFDGPFISPQKFRRFNAQGKYNMELTENNSLSVLLSAFHSKWNASGQIPQRAVNNGTIGRFGAIDNTEGGNTNRYNASVSLRSQLNNGHLLEQQAFYSKYNFQLFSNFSFFLKNPVDGDQIRQADDRNIYGYNSKYTIESAKGKVDLTTTISGGIRLDKTKNSELSHTKNRTELKEQIQLGDITELNSSIYVDEKIQVTKFLINIGARLDHFHFSYFNKLLEQQNNDQNKVIISPKFNLQYNVANNFQLYAKLGKGFHSNDTRVTVANKEKHILPAAYGADLGTIFKPAKNLLFNAALWYLYSEQEFVYVGDEGITEPSGKTRRIGFDLSGRYQINAHFFADANLNLADPRFIEQPKGANYVPLAPRLTSTGGINYQAQKGVNGSLRYKFIESRPANELNTVKAKGYTILDAALNYTQPKYELGIVIENILNASWNEAQFDTESRLKNEPSPVSELHFTPGTPFYAKLKIAFFF